MIDSCATRSDPEECSVSSDSDSNEVDLFDLVSDDIPVTIVEGDKGLPKKGTKSIPMFIEE